VHLSTFKHPHLVFLFHPCVHTSSGPDTTQPNPTKHNSPHKVECYVVKNATRAVDRVLHRTWSDRCDESRGLGLCSEATVTASLLSETQVGKEVKKLSKQGEDKEVAAAATAVVLAWKKVLLG